MARKRIPSGGGYVDFPGPPDPHDRKLFPGGYSGRETACALEDREPMTPHTQKAESTPYSLPPLHNNRSVVGEKTQVRNPTVEEGVSFSECMRADLDEDVQAY
jgi:hypothetical protein